MALDAPWPLAHSTAPAKIALYGRSPGAFDALAAVLAGKAAAPGKLPAAVGSSPVPGAGCAVSQRRYGAGGPQNPHPLGPPGFGADRLMEGCPS